jgi:hypothetical protein
MTRPTALQLNISEEVRVTLSGGLQYRDSSWRGGAVGVCREDSASFRRDS